MLFHARKERNSPPLPGTIPGIYDTCIIWYGVPGTEVDDSSGDDAKLHRLSIVNRQSSLSFCCLQNMAPAHSTLLPGIHIHPEQFLHFGKEILRMNRGFQQRQNHGDSVQHLGLMRNFVP